MRLHLNSSSRLSLRQVPLNALASWSTYAAAIVAAFVVSPIVVRGLGDQRYGVWSLVESILVYLTLFDFGLSASVVRYVARFEAIADPDRRNRVFSTSLALFGIIGVVIFAIAAALGAAGPFLFRIPPDLVVEAMDVRFAGAQLRTGAAVGHLSQRALRAGTLPHCVGNPGDIPDSRIHPDGDRHHPGRWADSRLDACDSQGPRLRRVSRISAANPAGSAARGDGLSMVRGAGPGTARGTARSHQGPKTDAISGRCSGQALAQLGRQPGRDARPPSITLAPKKLIRTRRAARGVPQSPRWRVGLVCARMRNFLAGVIAHSCREAERILGYIAPVPYREAMDLTASWLLFARLI